MEIEKLYQIMIQNIPKERVLVREPLKQHTTFQIGGEADLFVKLKTIEEAVQLFKIIKQFSIPFFILGNGSNVLVRDKGIRGIVIQPCFEEIEIKEEILTVGAGVKVPFLATYALKQGLSGMENLYGIPGSIGGLIRMNGGAYGSEIKDIVLSVTYLDYEGNIHTLPKENCEFSYRNSIFAKDIGMILSCQIQLKKGDPEEIQEHMRQNLLARKQKQPLEYPSAGSSFKRGKDYITAQLIDKAGLKGYKIGDAQISEKHAGFIINLGNATSEQVLELVDHVKKMILEKFQKEIELEMIIVGEE